MAKLTARGRTEIFRVERQLADRIDDITGELSMTDRKHVIVLMSDRKVLDKTAGTWARKAMPYGSTRYTTNWSVRGKLKAKVTPEQWLQRMAGMGYRIVA